MIYTYVYLILAPAYDVVSVITLTDVEEIMWLTQGHITRNWQFLNLGLADFWGYLSAELELKGEQNKKPPGAFIYQGW